MNEEKKIMHLPLRSFDSKILYFNGIYKLPIAPYPTCDQVAIDYSVKNPKWEMNPTEAVALRLAAFKHILLEEMEEIDIIKVPDLARESPIDLLVALSDLLGDIVVYCFSEAAKYGIPLSEVLSIIMDSNFSKLDADGKPVYDERGKVLKGPFYWKPEPKIKELLQERINESIGKS